MPLGDFEKQILRLLAANRNPDSDVAGATVLNRSENSPRASQDIDRHFGSVRGAWPVVRE